MAFLSKSGLMRLWMHIVSKLDEKLSKAGGTISGDLKITDGSNQRKLQIYRSINNAQYELQQSIDNDEKGSIELYKSGTKINSIKLGTDDVNFYKPIMVEGGASGSVAMQTRANLGIENLPIVTPDDAGKVLYVQSDGTWAVKRLQDLITSDEHTYLTVND